ncbi:MAG: MMPL family transporter, partial [bacterium]|nr:MMPL family transporter [bacterium]
LARTLAGTGRSIVLTSATTIAAFGTLAFTSHRGLASFAIALSLGVTSALVLSVVVLPGLLQLFEARLLADPRQAE